jgi:aryl-alcohol dehydrogenase-like predicted oxidoreductase
MEKIELYCLNEVILGWQVGFLAVVSSNSAYHDVHTFSRAETEKGLSRKHVIEGLRASLERLQLDYVDIVFANKPDASVPMEGNRRAREMNRDNLLSMLFNRNSACIHTSNQR